MQELGILDGVGELVGHRLQAGDVFLRKSARLDGLDGHRADNLVAADQRQRHLGMCVGQQWVLEAIRLFFNLQSDAGLPVGDAPANH